MSDFIERKAAIKLFNFAVLDCLGMEPTIRAGDIIKALESIPAADVRPVVKARWNVGADGWECSNCTIESNNTYPICPYCGADMREPPKEETE